MATWVETLTTRLSWERERDAGRIRKAFVTMAGTRRSWPAPIDLIEALPPPNEQNRIGRESSIPATAEQRARHLQNVLGEVAKPMTDRKSAAAGDS